MNKSKSEVDPDAHIFCISVKTWPKWSILLVGSIGIFGSFLLHGIAQEDLIEHFKITETFFLTFFQFLGYSLFSLPTFFKIIFHEYTLKAPLYVYIVNSLAIGCSMGLTNYAASRLNYATIILFKSSKLIPVLIGNILFLKKKPKFTEVIAVFLIVLGLIGVSLGDFHGHNKIDSVGVISIILSLIAGAVASNLEDKVMSVYGASQNELISMLYTIGSLLMLLLSIVTGQFPKGIQTVSSNPKSILFLSFFAFLGANGIQFVYLIMKVFGSLTTVMITSVRKALTVVLSFIVFRDKKFTIYHGISIILIVIGMTMSMCEKLDSKKGKLPSKEDLEALLNNEEEKNDNPANFKYVS